MGLHIGPLHVRRSTFVEAPPAIVWTHFTTEDAIKAWLDRGHRVDAFEPRMGGEVRLSIEVDGDRRSFGGSVLVFDAGRELSIETQWDDAMAWPMPTYWTIRLTGVYGGTLVELFHHGFERLGAAAADELEGYEGGWSNDHLVSLRRLAER